MFKRGKFKTLNAMNQVTPFDYAIHISNLPTHIHSGGKKIGLAEYEENLRSHICSVLELHHEGYRYFSL